MTQFDLRFDLRLLPTSAELPSSDDTPVDNVGVSPPRSEEQNFLPNFLLLLLRSLWKKRRGRNRAPTAERVAALLRVIG